jgi:hypothetical protein
MKFFALAILLTFVSSVSAQTLAGDADSARPRNPPMTSMRRDAEKEALYTRYLENKRVPIKENQRLAYIAAKEFIKSFGGDRDPYLPSLRKFVAEYERVVGEFELLKSYNAKDYKGTFERGRAILKTEPENFFVLSVLTQAGNDNALAGDPSLNSETLDYAQQALLAIESKGLEKADPFVSTDMARAYLNFTVGSFLKDTKPVEAAAAFREAVRVDGPYQKDPGAHYRLGVSILKGEFAQLSADYNQKFGNKPPSPEQQRAFEKLKGVGMRAVDAYARAVALSTAPEQQTARTKIMGQLTELYKGLNGSDAGLEELISSVLNKPLP